MGQQPERKDREQSIWERPLQPWRLPDFPFMEQPEGPRPASARTRPKIQSWTIS